MATVKVVHADRMMIEVTARQDGIQATFADGYSGTVPFREIPEVREYSSVYSVELPNPYEVILTTSQRERVELPWDFVRHYCDPTYRPRMELLAIEGKQILGERVRTLRENAGFSQNSLANAAGIGRSTMIRLENGKFIPKLSTLRAIAQVLDRPVEDLLNEPQDTGGTNR